MSVLATATLGLIGLALPLTSPAQAAEELRSADLEIVVTPDPFSRWDGTRWLIQSQVGMPWPVVLYAESNQELQIVGWDVRLVLDCALGPEVSRRIREVDCAVEDAALSAAPWLGGPSQAEAVIGETRDRLADLDVRLQVSDDGRVTNVTLAGEPQGIRRVNYLYENLRQIVRQSVVGFHLQAPDRYVLGEQWTERNAAVYSLPSFRFLSQPGFRESGVIGGAGGDTTLTPAPVGVGNSLSFGGAGTPSGLGGALSRPDGSDAAIAGDPTGNASNGAPSGWDLITAPASYGRSVVAHRMDRYKGHYIVQSTGEGMVDIGNDVPLIFTGPLSAVSAYRPEDAIMTERVWTLQLDPTASSLTADGVAGWSFFHNGNLKMLDPDEVPELGPSEPVSPPTTDRGNLPPWPMVQTR